MSASRLQTPILWFMASACLLVLAFQVGQTLGASSVWDDAWMFVRYADQLLASGVPAFEPGGRGVYGLTSPGFLTIVAPMRLAFGADAVRAISAASLFSGLLFLAFLWRMLAALTLAAPRRRAATFALVAFTLAYASPALARHFASGMDTMYALAYLSLWLLFARWQARLATTDAAFTLGAFGGAAFSVRPDLLIITCGVPLLAALLTRDSARRRAWLVAFAATLGVAALQSAFYAWWLHSPLPLPFWAKLPGHYGPTLRAAYEGVALRELLAFARGVWPLLAVIAAAIATNPSRWWAETSGLDKSLLAACAVFAGYHAIAVVPVMAYAQRFDQPLLPVLAFLAARSLAALARRFPQAGARALPATVVALAIAALSLRRVVAHELAPMSHGPAETRFDLAAAYHANWSHYWVALDQVSRLGDDLVIATTEVGMPLAMGPRRRMVDLAGLNETSMTRARVSADSVLRREQPDLVYLPHPHYAEMRAAILADPWFTAHYDVWAAESLRADMGVAVRRGGPYADTLRALFEASVGH